MKSYLNEFTNDMNLIKLANGAVSSLFQLSNEDLASIQYDMINMSFRYHYENNNFYRDLCQCRGFEPDNLNGLGDLVNIPLIPVAAYKGQDSHRLLSIPISQVEHEMRSTGTS